MLVMMVVMLAVVWLSRGHMVMMGHGGGHSDEHKEVDQQEKTAEPTAPAPQEATGNQH